MLLIGFLLLSKNWGILLYKKYCNMMKVYDYKCFEYVNNVGVGSLVKFLLCCKVYDNDSFL